MEIVVRGGRFDRMRPLVEFALPEGLRESVTAARGPVGGQLEGGVLSVEDADTGALVPAQLGRDGRVAFVLPGVVLAGVEKRLRVVPVQREPVGRGWPVQLVQKLDRVIAFVAGEPFTAYTVAGTRRPYFWPLLGPSGTSVVRGQGSEDHPHHTGLGINYGGHSEGGSVNIWADWDEAPYGPGGRMIHRGFHRTVSGPVYGEIVHDLTYVDAYGDPFLEEVRTIRLWWASATERFVDISVAVASNRDRGARPFLVMARLPATMDICRTGRVTNSAGVEVPVGDGISPIYPSAWADGSGPTADPPAPPPLGPPGSFPDMPGTTRRPGEPGTGPWDGIAVIDHPDNNGFPNDVGHCSITSQITQTHYPPSAADGPYGFRTRIFVHAGDAVAAGAADRACDFAEPCQVEVVPG